MEFKDYYKILEVEKTASAEEIKKKYRDWPKSIILIKIQAIILLKKI
jgi:hypothetical protein